MFVRMIHSAFNRHDPSDLAKTNEGDLCIGFPIKCAILF